MSLHVPVDRASRNEQPATRTDHSSRLPRQPQAWIVRSMRCWRSVPCGGIHRRFVQASPRRQCVRCTRGGHCEASPAVATSTSADIDSAVASARSAFDNVWGIMSPRERATLMREVAAHIRANAAELAELTAREVGKPVRDAACVDIVSSHSSFDYYAGIASTLHGEIIDQGLLRLGSTTSPTVWLPQSCLSIGLPFTSRRSALLRWLPETLWSSNRASRHHLRYFDLSRSPMRFCLLASLTRWPASRPVRNSPVILVSSGFLSPGDSDWEEGPRVSRQEPHLRHS